MDFSFFITDNKSGYKTTEKWLSNNQPDLYKQIVSYSENIPLTLSFKEKIWFFYNNLTERPKCLSCSSEIKFRERFDKPYGDFCSLKCINMNKEEMVKRQKKTFNQKYSVDFYPQHNEFITKQKKTKKEKYGNENYNNPEKTKKTKLEIYGDSKFNNLKKQQNTVLQMYGDVNISKTSWYKNHIFSSYKEKYPNLDILSINNQLVSINCVKCQNIYEVTKQLVYERYRRGYEVCTHCNPIGQNSQSGYELEINNFINEYNIETIQSYRKINNKEIDIYIPNKKMGIEINGVYWHNELFKTKDYHLNKTQLFNSHNISVIQIFEDEWLYKKDIVKSIIKNRLGLIENKIYSRNCEIREVSSNDTKDFLNENHIQGNVNSKIKIGLYYKGELVSLMTFSKGRIIMGGKKDEWELNRFCNKTNFVVVGAASKLFKFFTKNYKINKVISYSDVRLFDGKMYETLGFTKISQSKPNYWYVINDIRYHRFNFRKSILVKEGFDKNKTEKQIMFDRGIYRVYDCGNIRWEYSSQ